jgi:hypothetical protein
MVWNWCIATLFCVLAVVVTGRGLGERQGDCVAHVGGKFFFFTSGRYQGEFGSQRKIVMVWIFFGLFWFPSGLGQACEIPGAFVTLTGLAMR